MRFGERHEFHKICLLKWMKYSSSCPMCREKIEEERNIEIVTEEVGENRISEDDRFGIM